MLVTVNSYYMNSLSNNNFTIDFIQTAGDNISLLVCNKTGSKNKFWREAAGSCLKPTVKIIVTVDSGRKHIDNKNCLDSSSAFVSS